MEAPKSSQKFKQHNGWQHEQYRDQGFTQRSNQQYSAAANNNRVWPNICADDSRSSYNLRNKRRSTARVTSSITKKNKQLNSKWHDRLISRHNEQIDVLWHEQHTVPRLIRRTSSSFAHGTSSHDSTAKITKINLSQSLSLSNTSASISFDQNQSASSPFLPEAQALCRQRTE